MDTTAQYPSQQTSSSGQKEQVFVYNNNKKSKLLILLILLFVVVIALISGFLFIYTHRAKTTANINAPTTKTPLDCGVTGYNFSTNQNNIDNKASCFVKAASTCNPAKLAVNFKQINNGISVAIVNYEIQNLNDKNCILEITTGQINYAYPANYPQQNYQQIYSSIVALSGKVMTCKFNHGSDIASVFTSWGELNLDKNSACSGDLFSPTTIVSEINPLSNSSAGFYTNLTPTPTP